MGTAAAAGARTRDADPLQTYRRKRDFRRTAEPAGDRPGAREQGLQYCVQRHAARQLHYDFRLEWEGVLKSWAVPKGPSLDPDIKRLAVQTEDHPIEYGDFEGTIPAGEYGAGEVLLWDRGTWAPLEDPKRAFARGKIHFELHGRKLRGEYVLVRLGRSRRDWLLRKIADSHARSSAGDSILSERPESVRAAAPGNARRPKAARRSALPEFIAPQLATLASSAPTSGNWRYEIKYDGYRIGIRLSRSMVRLVSRNGNDWTARLVPLADRLRSMKLGEGWLDGEIIVSDEHGKTRFQLLQRALDGDPERVQLVVFDVLHWNGVDLRDQPLAARAEVLAQIFAGTGPDGSVRISGTLDGPGQAAWDAACRLGLEGLIAKRADAPYVNGRSNDWLKLKCRGGQEFLIGGYTEPSGSRSGLGALLVGVRAADGQLDYAGRVGTGFDDSTLCLLRKRLDSLSAEASPFRKPPRTSGARVHWVRPVLVVQVAFAEWTSDGLLRQASFEGLREDKRAISVQRERAVSASKGSVLPNGQVRVTHPERVVFPSPRITKLEVVRYYEAIAPAMFPHVKDRVVSMVRCPEGVAKACFFQKHIDVRLPTGTRAVRVTMPSGVDDYVAIEQAQGIPGLAQYGTIEFHTWGSQVARLEQPDHVTFDLDPGPGVPWPRLVEAARLTRELLAELDLTGFLKTTGGKGLHVVTPIRPTRDWDTVKAFAQAVAQRLEGSAPDRFTAKMSKMRRGGKIFIDYLRNARGATAVAAYSLRARKGAPVSTPLAWEELDPRRDVRAATFNLRNALARVAQSETAWQGYESARVTLKAAALRRLGVSPGPSA